MNTKENAISKRNPHSPVRGVDVPAKRHSGIAKIRLDKNGHELHDPVPIEPPLGYKRAPSLSEQIRTMVRGEALRRAAEDAGAETFEEADDFDVGDDYDPRSPYEEIFDPVPAGPTVEDQLARGVSRALHEHAGDIRPKTKEEAESLLKQGYVKVNEYFRKPPAKKTDEKDTPPE